MDLPAEDILTHHLRASGLVKIECISKVFIAPKLVLWCAKRFDMTKRVIQVGDTIVQLISLNSIGVQKMLRLPHPHRGFNIVESYDFIANHGGPKTLLIIL